MSETEASEQTENAGSGEGGWDPASANAWEDALIADMRAHGGRPSGGPLAGQPLLVLYTTGAKSGERRRAILTYSTDGADRVVAGTASGSPKTPGWVYNIEANPALEIEVDTKTMPVKATIEWEGPERDRLWNQHVVQLPWFGDYPSQTAGRVIPMVRLSKASA